MDNHQVKASMPSLSVTPRKRTLVCCDKTDFKTPLFSFDDNGIYLKCKDCHYIDKVTGKSKRGAYHQIPWATLDRLKLGLISVEEVLNVAHAGDSPSSDHPVHEVNPGSG